MNQYPDFLSVLEISDSYPGSLGDFSESTADIIVIAIHSDNLENIRSLLSSISDSLPLFSKCPRFFLSLPSPRIRSCIPLLNTLYPYQPEGVLIKNFQRLTEITHLSVQLSVHEAYCNFPEGSVQIAAVFDNPSAFLQLLSTPMKPTERLCLIGKDFSLADQTQQKKRTHRKPDVTSETRSSFLDDVLILTASAWNIPLLE